MPFEQGNLSNPHSNGPGSIPGVVPGAPQPAAAALPQQGSPAPMPSGPVQQSQPEPASGIPPAEDGAALFERQLQGKITGKAPEPKDPFQEMDQNFPVGYTPISPRLRKSPTGQTELLDDGKWRLLNGRENEAISDFTGFAQKAALRAKEDLPRFIGNLLGGTAGEMLGGPPGAVIGGGIGQAGGGALGDTLLGKGTSLGQLAKDFTGGAAAMAIPVGASRFLEQQAGSMAGGSVAKDMIASGAELMQAQAQKRIDAANDLGVPLRSDQINPQNPDINQKVKQILQMGGKEAQKLAQAQVQQKQMLLEARDNLVDSLYGPHKADVEDGLNWSNVLGNIISNQENQLGTAKSTAFASSGGQRYDLKPVLETMRTVIQKGLKKNIFNDGGYMDGRLVEDARQFYGGLPERVKPLIGDYLKLQNATMLSRNIESSMGGYRNSTMADELAEPVGQQSETKILESGSTDGKQVSPGITLPEMDVFRKEMSDEANFGKRGERDDKEKSYGEVYHSMAQHFWGKVKDALTDNNPEMAAQVDGVKTHYSNTVDAARDFQEKVAHDPTNAASALVDAKDPQSVSTLLSILDDKHKKILAGGFLDNLTTSLVDPLTGKMSVTPVETKWGKMDPKIKQALYGEDVKKIDSLVNVSRAIADKDVFPGSSGGGENLMNKAISTIRSMDNVKGGLDFFVNMFRKNPQARDVIIGRSAPTVMPAGNDAASMGKRQILQQHSAKILSTVPPEAYSALSADTLAPHQQAQQ